MVRWRFQWVPTVVFTVIFALSGVPGISVQSPLLDITLGAVFGMFIGATLGGFFQARPWEFRWHPTIIFTVLFALLGVPGISVQSRLLDVTLGAVFGMFIGATLGGYFPTHNVQRGMRHARSGEVGLA